MSYTKTIRKTVRIPYSGSVSYGPSQNGGSVSYSGTVTEEIEVNVEVDTDPFEKSINDCNQLVGGLTEAVVATEVAQIASINTNAKKVSGAIIKGFFSTIRSEITQQIAELQSQVDATLIHLRGLAQRCVEKQKQMERDYNSIAKRYLKTFEDLNNELSNRIYELNKPTFTFSKQSNQQNNRACENDLVSTVTIFAKEEAELVAQVSASVAKKRALDTIEKVNTFLQKQKQLEELINLNMLKESKNATAYTPICFIETENEQKQIDKKLYQQEFIPQMPTNELIDNFLKQNWYKLPEENTVQIERYFNIEVDNRYSNIDEHSSRVKAHILKMLQLNEIECI